MAPRVVLATVGSLGDLHPFIAIAQRLQALGIEPIIATAPDYEQRVKSAGVAFGAVRPGLAETLQRLGIDQKELARRAAKDSWFLFREAIFPALRIAYDDMLPVVEGASLVATSSLAFPAKLAAEVKGIRQVAVVLQPVMFFSAYDPPMIPELPWLMPLLQWLGPRRAGAAIRFLKRLGKSRAAPLHSLRQQLGLPPIAGDAVIDGQFPADGTALALYSDVFGGVQPDFPAHTEMTGFAFYDGAEQESSAQTQSLEQFLDAGPPPLVFTLGSFVVANAADFYAVSLEVARALGRRAVLLVGDTSTSSALRSDRDVFITDYAPYSMLFSRCAVIVHQGGIGTSAQALRAGRPQLVVPFSGDQPDNAVRLARLGVGRHLERRAYRPARVRNELQILFDDPRYATRATEVSTKVKAEDGARRAAQRLVELLP